MRKKDIYLVICLAICLAIISSVLTPALSGFIIGLFGISELIADDIALVILIAASLLILDKILPIDLGKK